MGDEFNPNFYCPITGDLLVDPVIDIEGNTYERRAIESWLVKNGTSPITRMPMTIADLRPNRSLRSAIEEELRVNRSNVPTRIAVPNLTQAQPNMTMQAQPTQLNLTTNSCYKKVPDGENADSEDYYLLTSVLSPELASERVASDIVIVVDISGSMGNEAKTASVESSGLTLLDVVKHAVKTIVKTLSSADRLSLITFSNVATKIFDLTPMSNIGKETAISKLDSANAEGMTNLWDGLYCAMEVLKNRQSATTEGSYSLMERNASILLLTDGEPNVEPPRGHIPMLKRYRESNGGNYPGIINTFGFGYTLDSVLLRNIAHEAGGMYSFIPDSGFVGTAFVNALGSILSTNAKNTQVSIEFGENVTLAPGGIIGDVPNVVSNSGVTLLVGSVQLGQPLDTVIRLRAPKNFSGQLVTTTTEFQLVGSSEAVKVTGTVTDLQHLSEARKARESQRIDASVFRLRGCEMISKAVVHMSARQDRLAEAQAVINTFCDEIEHWLNDNDDLGGRSTPASSGPSDGGGPALDEISDAFVLNASSRRQVNDLLEDFVGQVSQAVSRKDWYKKWGKHYLPSLQRAHQLQQCNNFKDPGIQHYGGKLFQTVRDVADDVFCKLPPPTAKAPPAVSSSTPRAMSLNSRSMSSGLPPMIPPPGPMNMAAFNDRDMPCFHEDCFVSIMGNTQKRLKDLQKGDVLKNGAVVRCIVRATCVGDHAELVSLGSIKVTPWHPVCIDGKWTFPADIGKAEKMHCVAVCSIVCESLDKSRNNHERNRDDNDRYKVRVEKEMHPYIEIEGIPCAVLGHGVVDDPVLAHKYFGTEAVISDLSKCVGWEKGRITFGTGCMLRDKESGLVCGYDLRREMIS
jgi:Mg-chelatase subunit ChlD